jgi:alpha-ketoglutarate-dependent 2,4-dichlorophenoxyacetate dioxygenase
MEIRPLHPLFAAELIGADLAQEPSAELVKTVEDAMAEYAVLVVRGQGHVGDAEHIRFSRAFGPLELPPHIGITDAMRAKRRFAPELYDASNLNSEGEIADPDSLQRRYGKGNEQFHTDSSFHDMPTKWSLLFGHIVTPERGETEFVDTRIGYERLPQAMKDRIEGLSVEHNVWRSREKAGFADVDKMRGSIAPAIHPLVRTSASGRKALYIGSHADHVIGMELEEGRALLEQLVELATTPDRIYAHQWRQGDIVIWDNRCTMHRATAFDYENHKRDLRRTTINEHGPERAANDRPQSVAAA